MSMIRNSVAAMVVLATVITSQEVQAAIPYVSGTYTTPTQQGTVKFNPVKRVIQFGYQGNYNINGKSFPGVLYFPRTGGMGVAWYYGVSGIPASNALLQPQADGTYRGPVWFFDRKGNQIDSGEMILK